MNNDNVVSITVETTPNPNTLKYLVHRKLLDSGSIDVTDQTTAKSSPLTSKMFELEDITGVLIGIDFVTITKKPEANWTDLAEKCVSALREVLGIEANLLGSLKPTTSDNLGDDDKNPIVTQIKEILDREIRPAVAMDGGDITFHGYKDGVVTLHLQGACSSCPSSVMTLKMGVENRLKSLIPEIKEVVQV